MDRLLGVVLQVALSLVLTIAVVRFVPGVVPSAGVVVLDVVRLNNSFRATAAPLIGKAQEGQEVLAAELSITGARALEAIQRVARGRLVLIKQATVGEVELADITGAVIADLGLREGSSTPMPDLDETEKRLGQYSKPKESQGGSKWQERVLP